MIRFVLVLLLCASPALAQVLPDAFSVTGVADDDVLNIRSAPSAASTIIGNYPPTDLNIEVLDLSADGKWGRVGTGEGNGWVAMRYLARSDPTAPNTLPRPFMCSGTEPFWTLAMTPRGDEYLTPDNRSDLTLTAQAAAPQGYAATFQDGPTTTRTLTVTRGICSDGMSDRRFGWQATLFTTGPDGTALVMGCCTRDVR